MLRWDWKERIGVLTTETENGKEVKFNIYQGNALMIFIWENEEDDTYQLYSFFADKEHFKNLLKEENFFKTWKSIRLWKFDKDIMFVIEKLLKKGIEFNLFQLPF